MNLGDLQKPEVISEQIRACRDELTALKRLLRMALAVSRAEAARRAREQNSARPDEAKKRR